MLIIGWIISIALIGFLYHSSLYSTKKSNVSVTQSGTKITLYRSPDSHFYIAGQINSKKINFVIDTGATITSIPENLANEANLPFGHPTTITTANGKTKGYLTRIPQLTIGPVEFTNIQAIILPHMEMEDEGLLGMNLLKKFTINQSKDTLTLMYKVTQQ